MLDNIMQLLPQNDEKALRQAFYTTAVMLLVLAASIVALYVYYVLEIFVKPLMWAMLTGSILFPLKHSLYMTIKSWMADQLKRNRLLITASVLLPVHILVKTSDFAGVYFTSRWKTWLALSVLFLVGKLVCLFPMVCALNELAIFVHQASLSAWVRAEILVLFLRPYQLVFATIFVTYILTIILFEVSPLSWIIYLGIPAWLSFVVFIFCFASRMQIHLGIVSILFFFLLVMALLKHKIDTAVLYAFNVHAQITMAKGNDGLLQCGMSTCNSSGQHTVTSVPNSNLKSSSYYISLLIHIALVTVAWSNAHIRLILSFSLLCWGLKQLIIQEDIVYFVNKICIIYFQTNFTMLKVILKKRYEKCKNVLYPTPVKVSLDVISFMDRKFQGAIMTRLPTLTSMVIILSILLGLLAISVFCIIQIQQEGILLMRMTAALVNETAIKHPEYKSWLPESEMVQKYFDTVMEKIYWYGKDWIKEKLDRNVGSDINTTLIETQALVLWDRAYHLWFNKTLCDFQKLPEHRKDYGSVANGAPIVLTEISRIANVLKHDMSALMSLLEWFFFILQDNFKILISLVQAIFMVFMYGGNAVLSFSVSVVVYLTATFYLLAESDDEYMPFRLIITVSSTKLWASPVMKSIQHAVSGVFQALLKMASFYGLYTWGNHVIMGSTFIYVPSLLAAVFSVIPALPTYCCCFPAVLELWFVQGSIFRGFLLVVLQVLPTMFVDVTIYREMTESGSGHPYVTGLSVIGGFYYYGLEGAIVGPIILCVLLVIVNAYFEIVGKPIDGLVR